MTAKSDYSVRVSAGDVYGNWVVVDDAAGVNARARVRCTCGRESTVRVHNLVCGRSKGCVPCRNAKQWETRRQTREPERYSYRPPLVPDGSCLTVVRQRLERARRDGADFDSAWTDALALSNGYRKVLESQHDQWAAAYEGRPGPRPETAFVMLVE